MRFSMGIGEKDRLPPPSYFSAETTDQLPELAGYGVPNWLSPMDESSVMVSAVCRVLSSPRSYPFHFRSPTRTTDVFHTRGHPRPASLRWTLLTTVGREDGDGNYRRSGEWPTSRYPASRLRRRHSQGLFVTGHTRSRRADGRHQVGRHL